MLPCREFLYRSMVSRWEHADIVWGILALSEFMLRLRYRSRDNWAMSGEMCPSSWLSGMWILARKLSSATQGNMLPPMFSDSRSSAMTRDACCLLHVTPCHSQNKRESSLQEANTPDGSWSWDLRQRRARRSVLDSLLVAADAGKGVAEEGHADGNMRMKTKASRSMVEVVWIAARSIICWSNDAS